MARKPRAEVEGGLYHRIAGGNNRQNIFNPDKDFEMFQLLLAIQKAKLGFYLCAHSSMSNRFDLLLIGQRS
jgi:putative transposase